MSILFLDDSPERARRFRASWPSAIIVSTAAEAITQLATQPWNHVLLDHDLGGEEHVDSSRDDTGMAVVRWIVDNNPIINNIIVHSLNTPARIAMVSALVNAGYNAIAVPYLNLYDAGFADALR